MRQDQVLCINKVSKYYESCAGVFVCYAKNPAMDLCVCSLCYKCKQTKKSYKLPFDMLSIFDYSLIGSFAENILSNFHPVFNALWQW